MQGASVPRNQKRLEGLAGTAVLVYSECRFSIHTSGCKVYLTLLTQLKDVVPEMHSATLRMNPEGAIWA